jgi:transcriptional regulator with XRE-family HTH domain
MSTFATGASGVLITIKQELDFTDEELARATGAGVRTIRRLLSEEERPKRTRLEERIDDLRTIAQILREAYSATATRSWLMARNRLLGFDRPIDRLGRGEFTAVREAAEAFVDGDYT